MNKFKKLLALLCATTLALVPLGACKGNGLTKIRLSEVTHSIFYAPLYIAINNGYMEEEGLEVELTNAGGADMVMTALTSKSADIGLMGPEATIYVNAQGKKDYPIIVGQLTKRDGSFLVGREAMPDFKWSDLEGKRVLAGRPGGVPAMTLQYVCNQNNLFHGENINLDTDVAFNMMGPVFQSDPTVDFTTLFEPTASEFVAQGLGHIVASVGLASGEVPYTAFSAISSYITKNPETIEKFLRAIVKGYNYLSTAPIDDVANALQPSFNTTSLESIKFCINSYVESDAWMSTPVMTKDAFNRLQDIMENAGTLSERADFDKMVDNSFAKKAYDSVKK